MIGHFNKLKTPIRSVETYPTIESQRKRFSERGWPQADCWSLWETWQNPRFFTDSERVSLDTIEPFDEWEEFALFGSHYILLHASTSPTIALPVADQSTTITRSPSPIFPSTIFMRTEPLCSPKSHRRFAAGFRTRNIMGQDVFINALGLGKTSRLLSHDVFHHNEHADPRLSLPIEYPSPRMCHTITDLGEFGLLLVGGRTSPSAALSDCWILRRGSRSWEQTAELPIPVYRHSVVRLGNTSLCLLAGGRTNEFSILEDWLLFDPLKGWIKCTINGIMPEPTFGNVLWLNSRKSSSLMHYEGLLCGGMLWNGIVSDQGLIWELNLSNPVVREPDKISCLLRVLKTNKILIVQQPSLKFKDANSLFPKSSLHLLHRFGAACPQGKGFSTAGAITGDLILVGGIANVFFPQNNDIFMAREGRFSWNIGPLMCSDVTTTPSNRPLMVGVSASITEEDLVVVGGGATCFSMGTFWNKDIYSFSFNTPPQWVHVLREELLSMGVASCSNKIAATATKLEPVPRIKIGDRSTFEKLIESGQPVIIEDWKIGECVNKWSPEYLVNKVGKDRKVSLLLS